MRKNFNFISEGMSEKDVWFQNPDNRNLLIQFVSELTFNDWMDYLGDDFSRVEEIMEMENDRKAAEMLNILHYENLVEMSSLNERRDESLEKNIWWEQHSEELINYARDLEYDDWLNFFNGDDTRVQPVMDSSDKEKAMTLLHILNIANLDGILNDDSTNESVLNESSVILQENKLSHDFVEQIRRIYEIDSSAIICGSTALFLYGLIERAPNDIDIVVSKDSQILQLKEYYSEEYKFDEHDTLEKLSNPVVLNRISNIARNASSIYTYMGAVKYMLDGEHATNANLPSSVYDILLGLWKKHKDTNESMEGSTGFEYAFTGKEITKVCVFESKGEVEHVRFSLDGINILLESPAVILEHKKTYDREKDKQDITSIYEHLGNAALERMYGLSSKAGIEKLREEGRKLYKSLSDEGFLYSEIDDFLINYVINKKKI